MRRMPLSQSLLWVKTSFHKKLFGEKNALFYLVRRILPPVTFLGEAGAADKRYERDKMLPFC